MVVIFGANGFYISGKTKRKDIEFNNNSEYIIVGRII